MPLSLLGLVIGAALGALNARRRGGKRLDLLQWAAVGGIIGSLIGLFATILVLRAGTA